MRQKRATARFLRVLGAFLAKHPEEEEVVNEVMNMVVAGERGGLRIHALHGPMKGAYAARISQGYRLVFVLEPDAVIFIDIGSHDEVY